MTKAQLYSIVSLLLRLVLGGIFLSSGLEKLSHLELFYTTAQGYKILTPELIQVYAGWLPWLEILAGVCLILGLFTRFAAGLAALLLTSFLIAVGMVLLRGDAVDCGCFLGGAKASPVSWELWFRDLLLLAGAGIIMTFNPNRWRLDALIQNKSTWKTAITVVLTLYCVGTGILAVNSETPKPPPAPLAMPPLLSEGTQAPDFQLKDLKGQSVSLSEYTGKQPVLIEFFATWCPHCQHSVPLLKSLQKSKNLKILTINAGDTEGTPSTAAAFQQQYHISYPILDHPSTELLNAYHISGFPTFYLIDTSGKIVWSHAGALDKTQYRYIRSQAR